MSGDVIIPTTHAGSLPRPSVLAQAHERRGSGGALDEAEFEALVREAVTEVVQRQVAAGITIVNDGEQGKPNFHSYHIGRLRGFGLVTPPADARQSVRNLGMEGERVDFPDYFQSYQRGVEMRVRERNEREPPLEEVCCIGPVEWASFAEVERDIANLKAAATAAKVQSLFMTAISPGTYAPLNLHYTSEDEYFIALANVMKEEYAAIIEAGLILQIDAPDLTTEYRLRRITVAEHLAHMDRTIDTINYATADLPPERIRVHVCWGADGGPHHRDIPLKDIVHRLLRLHPAGLVIPGANGRHSHEWRIWQDVPLPSGKYLVPGVIDSTANIIEHPEAVAERIGNYVSVVGPEAITAGVDCGFAYGQIAPSIIWAKMAALAEGAVLASTAIRRAG
jgi:5-methyltetrahydropteroyltriglutamate--homocysteine methyltransferase